MSALLWGSCGELLRKLTAYLGSMKGSFTATTSMSSCSILIGMLVCRYYKISLTISLVLSLRA